MEIPLDLKEFLQSGGQLKYDYSKAEPGKVGLCSLDELAEGSTWLAPEAGDGYYEVPAISLTNANDAYDPEYILLWLPNEKLYGSWDVDHWVLTVFPNTTWEQIAEDPAPYINAQWDHLTKVGAKFIDTSAYQIKPGMPF